MMQGIHKTEDFNSTINSNHPVIVKFEGADWCPDCKSNGYVD